ncbi:MAG: hypothetical protein KIH44_006015 [Octadecabacter sp.]|nr:hypothetical protein [Octadecabacter sp.]
MIAALTLLSLLIVSLTVVRIGGTALRLTGMSRDAARFQAISALTGTGFTTTEAEITMHHPIRRRILILLMFTGHLGVVSLASTVILGVGTADQGTLQETLVLMAGAVVVACILASSRGLDRAMCAIIAFFFHQFGVLDKTAHHVLLEMPNGDQLCEHTIVSLKGVDLDALKIRCQPMTIVSVNGHPPEQQVAQDGSHSVILCFAKTREQENFAKMLMQV